MQLDLSQYENIQVGGLEAIEIRIANQIVWRTTPSYRGFVDWLNANGVNGAVYDASNLVTLFQDLAGTVPVTATGQTVRRINDVSGKGNHLVRSGTNATLQQDGSGLYYINIPSGGFFTTADATGNVGQFSFTSAYVGVAATRTAQMSRNLFALLADNSNGLKIQDLQTSARFSGIAIKTGHTTVGVEARPASCPLGLPTALDAMVGSGEVSSWTNGGETAVSATQGGPVVKSTTFDGVSNAYICISANGRTAANHQSQFYGGLVALSAIPEDVRSSAMRWLRYRAGQTVVDANSYDIFGVIGQSNAQGADTDGSLSTSVPRGKGAHFVDRGFLRPIADPTQHIGDNISISGSAWPSFCAEWNDVSGRTAAIVGAAASGCGLVVAGADGSWGASGGLVEKATAKALAAIGLINGSTNGGTFRGFIYAGGEQDVAGLESGATTISAYKALIVDLRDRLRTGMSMPSLPLFLISADRRSDGVNDLGFSRLRQAQSEVASENPDTIHLVVPYQDFVGQGLMGSATHWNQVAQNEVGALAAAAIASIYGW